MYKAIIQLKNHMGRRAAGLAVLASLAMCNLGVVAQVPKGGKTAAKATAKCSGAWTGTITYTRTQRQSDSKSVDRVSGRGRDDRDWQMNYNYTAHVAVVEDRSRPGTSVGRANVEHSMTSVEKVDAVEKNSCDRGKTFQDMRGTSTSKTEVVGGASGIEANVGIGVNEDGTYSISVGVPQIKGRVSGSTSSTFSGQCTPKEGKSLQMPATETTLDGHSLTSDGRSRVDPADANQLGGSYTLQLPGGVTETISWSLQRCGAPLRITEMTFADMKFPNWNDWREITEQVGTIDGNLVKVKATILNDSGQERDAEVAFKETYKGDKWDGARPDNPLKDTKVSVRVPAGEATQVEMLWDTSGFAWYDDGRPRLVQRVKAELWEKNKLVDDETKNIKIAPKPLVLVHGLWSNWHAWESWQNILTTTHSYDWKAFPVGERADKGVMNTGGSFLSTDPTKSIGENAHELERYIKYAQEDRNAWHVDLVAHSMGGLISRWYIDQVMPPPAEDGRPKVSHLIMLGTPNMGSPCADVMNVAFEALGKNVEAVRQLRTDYAEGFNSVHTQRKGVKFSALAGNPLPTMCKQVVWNDGVVSVPSAKWIISDTAESRNVHTELTGTSDFSSFVKPRLAIGPSGNHAPDVQVPTAPRAGVSMQLQPLPSADLEFLTARGSGPYSIEAEPLAYRADEAFARSVKVGAKQTVEIDVPVAATQNFGLTFMGDPTISATLVDNTGKVAGKNVAGSPEARGYFRSIFVDHPVTAGTWKIRLENTGDREYEVVLTTWKDAMR